MPSRYGIDPSSSTEAQTDSPVDFLDVDPPSGAPPLLTIEQVSHLAFQGWLQLDLPPRLATQLEQLSEEAIQFFDGPVIDKETRYPASRGTELGFYKVPGEKEYLTFRQRVHHTSGLEDYVALVWRESSLFLYRILCDLARAAEISTSVWDHLLEDSMSLPDDCISLDDVLTLLRLFRYYPGGGFASPHSDLGLLTLCVGNAEGLQVLDRLHRPPKFIHADGAVIVVGSMLRELLQHRVRVGIHRVVPNLDGRHSIVFAMRPCLYHHTDMATFGGHGIVDTAELLKKIKDSKWNINATREVRERQQQQQQQMRQADEMYGQG